MKLDSVSPQKFRHYKHNKYRKIVHKYVRTNIPISTAEKKSIVCNIQLKIYLKYLIVKKN
jgi:hypothetical protein